MRYSDAEMTGIRNARRDYPSESQRGLANIIYNNRYPYLDGNFSRSLASIYSVVRRVDAEVDNKRRSRRTPSYV